MTPTPDLKAAALAATPELGRFKAIIAYLIGKGALDGVWYGQQAKGPKFWWRIELSTHSTALLERLQLAEDAAKDAERYRMIRTGQWGVSAVYMSYGIGITTSAHGDDLDRIADEALAFIAERRLTPQTESPPAADEWVNPFYPTPCTREDYEGFKAWKEAKRSLTP